MKLSAAFPSKYLKADDLQGRSFNVQISHYAIEDVGTDDKPRPTRTRVKRRRHRGGRG